MAKGGRRKGAVREDRHAPLGLEAQLWAAADALRNNMDAAEYKHVVLGLILLKYISDAFEAKHAELASAGERGDMGISPFSRHYCPDGAGTVQRAQPQ